MYDATDDMIAKMEEPEPTDYRFADGSRIPGAAFENDCGAPDPERTAKRSGAATPTATAIGMYREWSAVREEWYRRAEAGEDWQGPAMSRLYDRRVELEARAMEQVPDDAKGAALLAAMLWGIDGPDCPGEENKRTEALTSYPAMKMKLRLLEWAEGVLKSGA